MGNDRLPRGWPSTEVPQGEPTLGPGRKAAVETEVAEVSRRRVCLPGVWRLALLATQNGATESRKHACLCLCLSSR